MTSSNLAEQGLVAPLGACLAGGCAKREQESCTAGCGGWVWFLSADPGQGLTGFYQSCRFFASCGTPLDWANHTASPVQFASKALQFAFVLRFPRKNNFFGRFWPRLEFTW
jgi:hypothetical protein